MIIFSYFILENSYIKDWLVDHNKTETEKRSYFSNRAFDIIIRMLSFASEPKDEIDTFLLKSNLLLNVVKKSDEAEQKDDITEESNARSKELIKEASEELQKYGRHFVSVDHAKKIASSLFGYKGGRSGGGRKKTFNNISQIILKEKKDSVTVITDITLKEENPKQRKSSPTKHPKKDFNHVIYSRFPENVGRKQENVSSILAIDNKRKEQSSTPSLSFKQTTVGKKQPGPSSMQGTGLLSSTSNSLLNIEPVSAQKVETSPKRQAGLQETPIPSEPIPSNILSMHPSVLLESLPNIHSLAVDLLQFAFHSSQYYEFENDADMRFRCNELFTYRKFGNCAQCIRNNTVKSTALTFPCIHSLCRNQADIKYDNSFCCEHYAHELNNGHCMFNLKESRDIM